jgi:hypothetical protein
MAAVLSRQSAPRSIVFLDASLGDAQVVLLDPERDVGELHIIGHGDSASRRSPG